MRTTTPSPETPPTDAVITWVDGKDPEHRRKRRAFDPTLKIYQEATADTRFADCGEIYHTITSIVQNAPWIRTVWLVTDDQKPAHLDTLIHDLALEPGRVQIVDHRTLFSGMEHVLPTFNSMSIESTIWRIPGLADDFVYFNDDVMLARPVDRAVFFREDGKIMIHGVEEPIHPPLSPRGVRSFLYRGVLHVQGKNTMRHAARLSSKLVGARTFITPYHHPHPFRASLISAFFHDHPKVLRHQVRHRFRSSAQFLPSALYYQLALRTDQAVHIPDHALTYITFSGPQPDRAEAVEEFRLGKKPFACIQSLDMAEPDERKAIQKLLTEKYQ